MTEPHWFVPPDYPGVKDWGRCGVCGAPIDAAVHYQPKGDR